MKHFSLQLGGRVLVVLSRARGRRCIKQVYYSSIMCKADTVSNLNCNFQENLNIMIDDI